MKPSRLFAQYLCLIAFAVHAEPVPVETTPKLENLNSQIKTNAENRLQLQQAIEIVTHPAGGFASMSPFQTQVHYRLANVLWIGKDTAYKFDPRDTPKWRDLMRNEAASHYGRLCAAYFLLRTDEEAQKFISKEVRSDDLRHRYNAAVLVLDHFETNRDFAWDADLMISLLADGSLDGSGVLSSPHENFRDGDRDDIMHTPIDDYCWRLGQFKVARAVDALISVVTRGAPAQGAPFALGEIGNPKAIPVLLKLLHSTRADRAATALGTLKCREAAPFIAATLLDRKTAGIFGEEAFLGALRDIGDKSVVPVLEQFVASEKNPRYKASAVRVLVQLKEKDPVSRLLEMLRSETYEPERSKIVRDLTRYSDDRVIHALVEMIQTSDSAFMRRSAIYGLSESGSQKGWLALAGMAKVEFPKKLKAEWGWKGVPDDFNKELHSYIYHLLVEATKHDFGEDAEKWIVWIKANPSAPCMVTKKIRSHAPILGDWPLWIGTLMVITTIVGWLFCRSKKSEGSVARLRSES